MSAKLLLRLMLATTFAFLLTEQTSSSSSLIAVENEIGLAGPSRRELRRKLVKG